MEPPPPVSRFLYRPDYRRIKSESQLLSHWIVGTSHPTVEPASVGILLDSSIIIAAERRGRNGKRLLHR
jgi:hypothetical protein